MMILSFFKQQERAKPKSNAPHDFARDGGACRALGEQRRAALPGHAEPLRGEKSEASDGGEFTEASNYPLELTPKKTRTVRKLWLMSKYVFFFFLCECYCFRFSADKHPRKRLQAEALESSVTSLCHFWGVRNSELGFSASVTILGEGLDFSAGSEREGVACGLAGNGASQVC